MSEAELVAMSYPVMSYHRNTVPGVQEDSDVPFHRHDGFEFYLFLNGSVDFFIDDGIYSPVRGDLYIVSPDHAHRGISRGIQPYERFIINIRKDRIKEFTGGEIGLSGFFDGSEPRPYIKIHLSSDVLGDYLSMASKLATAVYLRNPGDDLLVNAYITELLVLSSRLHDGNREDVSESAVPELVTDVKNYIFEHLTEQIVLEDLSRQFFFNGKYISAMFKKYTGMTIRSYILDQRITLAKRLLREGSNVAEACYHSGFLDYTNFIRSFTRSVGMSPGKYSRCARAGALGKF